MRPLDPSCETAMPRRRCPGFLSLLTLSTLLSAATARAQWLPPGTPVAYGPGDQTEQTLVADGAGGVVVCWRDLSSLPYRIRAVRLTGSGTVAPGWTPGGVTVGGGVAFVITPEIASDGAGGAFVVALFLVLHLTGVLGPGEH